MQAISKNNFPIFPQELTALNQWVLWKLEPLIDRETGLQKLDKNTGKPKFTKIPYQINGKKAGSTLPETWTSYQEVLQHYQHYNGIGFVLTDKDPFTVIDLDNCIADGKIQPDKKAIVDTLDSYTEYSQSGTGAHLFIKAKKPGNRSKNTEKDIELYDNQRFIAMTGNHMEGTPIEIYERQDILNYIYDSYFPVKAENAKIDVAKTSLKPSPQLTDKEILKIARKAKNGDKFIALYQGDYSSYGSQSEADQGLCNYLAFYTQDSTQIDRLFTNSGLYREKWDRADYKAWTIQKAIDGLKNTYQKRDFQDFSKNNVNDLQGQLVSRRFEELEAMEQAWEESGGKGRKPTIINPNRCAQILMECIEFILFDLEENTRVAMYLQDEGIYTRNTTLIKRVISWLEPKHNNNKADEVIYHLTNNAPVRNKTESRYLIPVKNGVFNLKTKKLEPFSSKYVFTSKISTPYIDNPIKPVLDGWDVETWLESIACGDHEIVKLLWQVLNDSLNGNYSRKKAIFLTGDGNNGKGSFQELITNLIGLNNIATLKVNEFDQRFRLSVIEGKTAIIGDDVPVNVYIDDSSNFNSVVTGDVVSVEMKNKPIYNTAFKCSVIQSTNGMPKFRNKSNGTLRRLVIVPFNAKFDNSNENLKIKDEYIKNEAVLQYVLHKAIRMDFDRFDIPTASLNELEIFKQDNDPVLDFKVSVFDNWTIQKVPKYVVYGFYKRFCLENGYMALSDRQFHKQFKSYLGNEWKTDAQGRFHAHKLIEDLGTMDFIGISFGDKSKVFQCYENTRIKSA